MNGRRFLNISIILMFALIFVALAVVSNSCSSDTETAENQSEHVAGSEDIEGNEESGDLLTLSDTYDTIRKGARLIMSYDVQSNAFVGTVENTTTSVLRQVRVEVHLSNGLELGPTTPVDLAPGEEIDVTLPATSQAFDGWTPHAEVSTQD